MIIEILSILYFIFFLVSYTTILGNCYNILDGCRFNKKIIYIVAFLNAVVYTYIAFNFNQLPTVTYMMYLIGTTLQLAILFKNNIFGILICSLCPTIYLVCTESIVISVGALVGGRTLTEITHNHQLLFSHIVASWFVYMIVALSFRKLVPAKYLKIINRSREQAYFMLAFLVIAAVYLTLNSFIYGYTENFTSIYLPLHQAITPLVWASVVTLAIVILARFDYLHYYKDKSDTLEKTIEKEKMLNEYIMKNIDSLYEINCDTDTIQRVVQGGVEQSVIDMPKYSIFVQDIIENRLFHSDIENVTQNLTAPMMKAAFERGETSKVVHFKEKSKGGGYRWLEITATMEKKNGNVIALQIVRDINAEKTELIDTRNRAERDSLVDAYNKTVTTQKINEHLAKGKKGTFFILDIDDFKNINDTKGHPYGDKVLVYLFKRMANTFRENDIIGRIGGDEFIVFLKNTTDTETINHKADMLLNGLDEDFKDETGVKCNVTISVGISVSPMHGVDFDGLYKNADLALYKSKRLGKNRYTIYNNDELAPLQK